VTPYKKWLATAILIEENIVKLLINDEDECELDNLLISLEERRCKNVYYDDGSDNDGGWDPSI
jgi:hypothetical protein